MSFKRSISFAAAVIAAGTVSVLPASTAFADAGNPYAVGGVTQENASNTALVNPTATVQLDIHKYLGATGAAGNGTEQTVTGQPALQGVDFDVYRVFNADGSKVDLTTNAGWEAASAIKGYTPAAADISAGSFVINGVTYKITKSATVTTNGSGTATFTKPDGVGLYLVTENLATSGTITNLSTGKAVDKGTITPAKAFFVTLPMTNPTDTSRWMYDVNVYPKNQSDTITKAVADKGTVTTDNGNVGNHALDYMLTSTITDGSTPLGMYVLYDNLDPALTFTGVDLKLSDGTALTTGTDYTVYTAKDGNTPATAYTSGSVARGPLVTVVMTDAGLAKLEAHRSADVLTTIHTVGAMDADGLLPNTASFIPNQGWWDQNGKLGTNPETPTDTPPGDNPGVPSNEVKSYYGNVVVNKYDPQDAAANMAGAVFSIFADPTPGDGTCSSSDVAGTAINSGTITTNNQLTFTGLQASNWYNGAEQTALLSYCLVETKAPTNYNLDATPHYVTIDWKTATTSTPAFTTEKVANEKSNFGNSLPLTGGQGVAGLSALGLLLVGGGVLYAAKSRRREEEQEA